MRDLKKTFSLLWRNPYELILRPLIAFTAQVGENFMSFKQMDEKTCQNVSSLGLKETSQAIGDDRDRWERLKYAVCLKCNNILVGITPIYTYPSFAEGKGSSGIKEGETIWILHPISGVWNYFIQGNPWLNKTLASG